MTVYLQSFTKNINRVSRSVQSTRYPGLPAGPKYALDKTVKTISFLKRGPLNAGLFAQSCDEALLFHPEERSNVLTR